MLWHVLRRPAIFAVLLGTDGYAASTVTVNALGDAGPGNCTTTCTLRDAIAVAASGDSIDFTPGLSPGTITLTQGELLVDKPLTIHGPGPALLAISANASSRVLNVSAGAVTISALTLRDGTFAFGTALAGAPGTGQSGWAGTPASGGCITIAAAGSLILNQADVRNCVAKGGNGGNGGSGTPSGSTGGAGGAGGAGANGSGGGIFVGGALTLLNSSLVNGAAYGGAGGKGGDGGAGSFFNGAGGSGGGGGMAAGGAIYAAAGSSLWLVNSTLAGSVAIAGTGGNGGNGGVASAGGNGGNGGAAGGGLVYVMGPLSVADVEFATLTNGIQTPQSGGVGGLGSPNGIPGPSGGIGGAAISTLGNAVTVLSSIVVGTLTPLCDSGVAAAAGSANLDQDSSCSGFTLHDTFTSLFRPLDLNTPWPAYTPVYHSMAIDAAADCNDLAAQLVVSDQHGTSRPQGAQCDLGAIEADYIFVDGFGG